MQHVFVGGVCVVKGKAQVGRFFFFFNRRERQAKQAAKLMLALG